MRDRHTRNTREITTSNFLDKILQLVVLHLSESMEVNDHVQSISMIHAYRLIVKASVGSAAHAPGG